MSTSSITAPVIRLALKQLDRVISMVSFIAVPILVSTTILWSVDSPPQQTFKFNGSPEVAQPGQQIELSYSVGLQSEMKHASYYVLLMNQEGDTVYVYPSHFLGTIREFDLSDLRIKLPESLKAGSYRVRVRIVYWFNPFKNGVSDFEVATLNVN